MSLLTSIDLALLQALKSTVIPISESLFRHANFFVSIVDDPESHRIDYEQRFGHEVKLPYGVLIRGAITPSGLGQGFQAPSRLTTDVPISTNFTTGTVATLRGASVELDYTLRLYADKWTTLDLVTEAFILNIDTITIGFKYTIPGVPQPANGTFVINSPSYDAPRIADSRQTGLIYYQDYSLHIWTVLAALGSSPLVLEIVYQYILLSSPGTSSLNLVADSDITNPYYFWYPVNQPGTTSETISDNVVTQSFNLVTSLNGYTSLNFSRGSGLASGNSWVYVGTGNMDNTLYGDWVQITGLEPGIIYTLSGYIDASYVLETGQNFLLNWTLTDGTFSFVISQAPGTSGRVSLIFTTPNNLLSPIYLYCILQNIRVSSGKLLHFSNPEINLGNTLPDYSPGSSIIQS